MVGDERGPAVPELARRLLVTSCHIDPVRAFVAVLERVHDAGTAIRDVISDSGYAHRAAEAWALPLRRLGARLIQDLHPSDRGAKGTHAGAIIANGNLFCPCTPRPLYPGPTWRHSYARRTAAERAYASTKDPATNDAGRRGWCRLTGLTAITLFLTALYIARNDRIVAAFEAPVADNARRAANGQPPRTRRRRRRTLDDLIDSG
jgi:hypothetical protein